MGNIIGESPFPVNPAGFVIHSAVHAARDDVGCVLHTHTVNGIGVSAQKGGVLPISQQSIFVLSSLGYHGYEGVALRDDEKPRLVNDLGGNTFLMLRNHGLLTVGASIADAFLAMYMFETTCAIQLRAQSGGGELVQVHPMIVQTAQQQAEQVTRNLGGQLAWPACCASSIGWTQFPGVGGRKHEEGRWVPRLPARAARTLRRHQHTQDVRRTRGLLRRLVHRDRHRAGCTCRCGNRIGSRGRLCLREPWQER